MTAEPTPDASAGEPEAAFLASLPKVELHVHLVGSAAPATVARLATRYEGRTPVPADPVALARWHQPGDLRDFLRRYTLVTDLVRDAADVWLLVVELARGLAAQRVRYAEVTVTPYAHLRRGIPAEELLSALTDARRRADRDWGVRLAWCFDIPAETDPRPAAVTLDLALRGCPDGLVALGLGGAESVPRAAFRRHFERAVAAGLRSAPHAGESTGPAEVADALRLLRADRIGHAVGAATDPVLLAEMADRGIPVEVCPTSNLCTGVVPDLANHPLRTFVAAGVPVSVNSDDPGMFHTTLTAEYRLAANLLGLDRAGIVGLAHQAVSSAFLPPAGRAALHAEIDAHLRRYSYP